MTQSTLNSFEHEALMTFFDEARMFHCVVVVVVLVLTVGLTDSSRQNASDALDSMCRQRVPSVVLRIGVLRAWNSRLFPCESVFAMATEGDQIFSQFQFHYFCYSALFPTLICRARFQLRSVASPSSPLCGWLIEQILFSDLNPFSAIYSNKDLSGTIPEQIGQLAKLTTL